MTRKVPTNIITGFLGTGKTTTILNLLKNKPANENWAVLVNEFGEIETTLNVDEVNKFLDKNVEDKKLKGQLPTSEEEE